MDPQPNETLSLIALEENEKHSHNYERLAMFLLKLSPDVRQDMNVGEFRIHVMNQQWEVIGVERSHTERVCPCGAVNLLKLCYIRNRISGFMLFVGSTCIQHFLNTAMADLVKAALAIASDIVVRVVAQLPGGYRVEARTARSAVVKHDATIAAYFGITPLNKNGIGLLRFDVLLRDEYAGGILDVGQCYVIGLGVFRNTDPNRVIEHEAVYQLVRAHRFMEYDDKRYVVGLKIDEEDPNTILMTNVSAAVSKRIQERWRRAVVIRKDEKFDSQDVRLTLQSAADNDSDMEFGDFVRDIVTTIQKQLEEKVLWTKLELDAIKENEEFEEEPEEEEEEQDEEEYEEDEEEEEESATAADTKVNLKKRTKPEVDDDDDEDEELIEEDEEEEEEDYEEEE